MSCHKPRNSIRLCFSDHDHYLADHRMFPEVVSRQKYQIISSLYELGRVLSSKQ